jgi:hypothetical protein
MKASRIWSGLLLVAAVVLAANWWLQRQAGAELRTELVLARDEQRELARLRAENIRLDAALPGAAEFQRLEADHAAVERMRNEIAALRTDIQRRERALAAGGM